MTQLQTEAGQWIDSPSGRIARTHEIDAAWQQLWQAEYGSHVQDQIRASFDEDYQTWQAVKEKIAAMGIVSLMSPPTGDLLERWHVRATDWFGRFKELGVAMVAPSPQSQTLTHKQGWLGPPTPASPAWDKAQGLVWALAGLVVSGAAMILVTKWAGKHAGVTA